MSLPTSYLTTTKNLGDIFSAMQSAQAPKKFTLAFLEGLGFKSTNDRLIIGVLKALGFLNPNGSLRSVTTNSSIKPNQVVYWQKRSRKLTRTSFR